MRPEAKLRPENARKVFFLAIFVYVSSFKEFYSVLEAISWDRESLYNVFEVLKFWS